jgi:hypothetical protein
LYTEQVYDKDKPRKLLPNSECIPNYRDVLVFFDGNKPVAWVYICFECHQIQFSPKVKEQIYYYSMTWDKLSDYFQTLGHDVEYYKNWR